MNRYLKYTLFLTFLAAILAIVFLQFNSNRSMNQLMNGNGELLNALTLKNNLQQIQTGIAGLESKLRGTVIEGSAVEKDHLLSEIKNIEHLLRKVDTLRYFPSIKPLLDELTELVNAKITFTRNVLLTLNVNGEEAAEELINRHKNTGLTDTIKDICLNIEMLHQQQVTAIIEKADANGRRAKVLGTITALMAALASIFTFGYVAYKVRQQQLLITKLDASEKKAKEAAVVKENFLANMSHEIRTPLNAILGFTNLLLQKNLDSDAKKYVSTIETSGENLLTIVNDILDLSKIEAGMMRIETVPFSIRGLVHSIETMFRNKTTEKKLQLSVHIQNEVPDVLEGDATRLTQILVNLIGNAVKFTAEGFITIKITNEGITNNTLTVGISISDTGIGIEKNKLNTIFERFQQAEDSVTRQYGGSGLGLTIVHDLVQLQKGSIEVKSELNNGTVFYIKLPYSISAVQTTLPQSAINDIETENEFEKAKVLVVEDNEINQTLMYHFFSNWKLDFEIVNNGKEALDALRQKTFSLVLMDIQMPVMDGYTATQQIRNSLHSTIPIIAMTAHAMAGEREKCISFGMDDYISKPIREELLRQLIHQFLKKEAPVAAKNYMPLQTNAYSFINLGYMKEVSNGNKEYERTVTQQFIETIPQELTKLEAAWKNADEKLMQQTAHNLKTTVSVMGLTDQVQPILDALEYKPQTNETFFQQYGQLFYICNQAVEEAAAFYKTIL